MPPQGEQMNYNEGSPLLESRQRPLLLATELYKTSSEELHYTHGENRKTVRQFRTIGGLACIFLAALCIVHTHTNGGELINDTIPIDITDLQDVGIDYEDMRRSKRRTGGYKLTQAHEGNEFFKHYNFYDGHDSLGSAGYNSYVGYERAKVLGILNVTNESVDNVYHPEEGNKDNSIDQDFVYLGSSPTNAGPRESLRLEGKKLHNDGLFIIDLRHMPAGCGIWPAFWLTNEKDWPDNGEIDIVEGVNFQSVAKTALHSNEKCSMYGHVPEWVKTGDWDIADGVPDPFTQKRDYNTTKPADDCSSWAGHQWWNQGCIAVSPDEGTLGVPFNENGGGVFALEWDPNFRRIRTWAFSPHTAVPKNLELAINTAHLPEGAKEKVMPNTDVWPLPYGYFAIGEETGCEAHHFNNMRLVFNLAFCGEVAGNRYTIDCPVESKKFMAADKHPVKSCNKYIKETGADLMNAYWKIRGVYVYKREEVH